MHNVFSTVGCWWLLKRLVYLTILGIEKVCVCVCLRWQSSVPTCEHEQNFRKSYAWQWALWCLKGRGDAVTMRTSLRATRTSTTAARLLCSLFSSALLRFVSQARIHTLSFLCCRAARACLLVPLVTASTFSVSGPVSWNLVPASFHSPSITPRQFWHRLMSDDVTVP